jgi:hypothetical protein
MGFQTPDVSSSGGYAAGGGGLGFLGQFLTGLHNTNQEKKAEKQQGVENKQKADEATEKKKMDESTIQHQGLENTVLQAGLAKDAEATKAAQAQTVWDNITRQLQNNPEIAKDPSLMQGLTDSANTLHKVIVKNKDGTLNIDSLMPKQFSDLTEEQKQYYAGLDPESRKNQMRDIGGKDPAFMSANPVHTYKEETERKRAETGQQNADTRRQYDLHKEHVEDVKLTPWMRLAAAKAALVEATTSEERNYMQAKIVGLYAQANKARVEASAVGPRLHLMQESLDNRSRELDLQTDRLRFDSSPNSLKNVMNFTKELNGVVTKTQGELTSAEKTLEAYAASKSDGKIQPEDSLGIQLQTNVHRLNDSLELIKRKQKTAENMVKGYEPQGMTLTQNSGKQSTILPRKNQGGQPIGNAPAGTADGTETTYNGKTLVARGGKFYAK